MPDHSSRAMDVVHGIDALESSFGRLFIAIGVFDGLHLGHLYLLNYLKEAAGARAARSTVITFDHHPDEILTGAAPPLLCDPDERLELLAAAGVEVTVVQHFDLALRMTTFEDFVRRIASRVTLTGFLMTPDSAFGNERRGTPEAVAELGRSLGYDTIVVPSLDLAGRPVRSAEIRADIAAGDLAGATSLLGRPYSVVGRAAPGTGSAVNFTVPMPVALPPAGRYGAWVSQDGAIEGLPGTVDIDSSARMLIEAPGFRDVAGRRVRVTFAPGGRLPDPDVAATIRRS